MLAADLTHPCIDLSLKTRALFFSQQPFDVCREAFSLPEPHGRFLPNYLCTCASLTCRHIQQSLLAQTCSLTLPSHARGQLRQAHECVLLHCSKFSSVQLC